ncbi:MAG: galactokinase [Pseudomonadota bacterium]|nr:galactokinase [Pseudomonadota bacterium]
MRAFSSQFGFEPSVIASAPGRVNLLGDHTDYNDGFVLPTATTQSTTVGVAQSRDSFHDFYSVQLGSRARFRDGSAPPAGFADYVHGCIEVLRRRNLKVGAITVCIDSQVPVGAGLSSSAALEVATIRALRELYGFNLDDVALALLAQQAEIEFAHVNCGVMDQMASSLGSNDRMLFLDTRSLETRQIPFPNGAEILIVDSNVPRTLAGSAYNERRAQCEEASRLLGVSALRDITDVDSTKRLPKPLDVRARHVVSENNRVLAAAQGVDAPHFGALMTASHASLRDDYQVSVPEVDYIVACLQADPQVYGARMTGAGFGGACVALIKQGARDAVARSALSGYFAAHSRHATTF